ncbi:FAD-dependent oxidoreductase [Actinophytocola gossypii]|uniref:FAD-dependent oxidoreductase n=1 Tax=Actinophytocola gossypii TaxID=2812003 RepID=A0ABT2J7Q8_9PSEU|nr:FAD-dependent oxidoreductase [Actinophytocola gossypii]MCT2583818.1 FAD-dependent oxidoreductase [Actinophytocola gossypii]
MTGPHDHTTAVLIVGGGITGLSTALFLTRLGVRSTLVERHPSTAIMPQARAFNPRSMEIYRTLGLEKEIRARTSILADLPEMIGADTLTGQERFRVDLLAQVRPPTSLSPTDWGLIDQDELELVVRAAAERRGAGGRVGPPQGSPNPPEDGVRAVVRDLGTGAEHRVHADYLVAADGSRAGVRDQLGVGADGPGVLGHSAHFVFDADLGEALRGPGFLLAYLDQPATGTVLAPLRQRGRWMLGVPFEPRDGQRVEDFTEQRCVELVRRAVGVEDLDSTLVPLVPGSSRTLMEVRIGGWVARGYRAGRVFFAGDSAHVVPPSGSYGANTGIADAHNLAWKLAAVLGGQAGQSLLDTYEDERRPVAQLTLDQTMRLLRARHHGTTDELTAIDDLAMIFGYWYDSAAVLVEPPGPDGPVEDPRQPSGRPGLRAPHVWLDRAGTRLSSHDLFTGAFTVLVGPHGGEWAAAARTVAASLGVELDVHQVGIELHDPEGRFLDAYGITAGGMSLVRPDGFVAWRADGPAPLPEHELERVLGRLLARDHRAR